MADTHYNSVETNDFPLGDVESFIEDVEDSLEGQAGGVTSAGTARRSLEERREAQRLRQLLADYAWDEKEI